MRAAPFSSPRRIPTRTRRFRRVAASASAVRGGGGGALGRRGGGVRRRARVPRLRYVPPGRDGDAGAEAPRRVLRRREARGARRRASTRARGRTEPNLFEERSRTNGSEQRNAGVGGAGVRRRRAVPRLGRSRRRPRVGASCGGGRGLARARRRGASCPSPPSSRGRACSSRTSTGASTRRIRNGEAEEEGVEGGWARRTAGCEGVDGARGRKGEAETVEGEGSARFVLKRL